MLINPELKVNQGFHVSELFKNVFKTLFLARSEDKPKSKQKGRNTLEKFPWISYSTGLLEQFLIECQK